MRIAIASKGKGKSGGARVITYVLLDQTTVYRALVGVPANNLFLKL